MRTLLVVFLVAINAFAGGSIRNIRRAAGEHLREGEQFRINGGSTVYTVVKEIEEAGSDRRVYKVKGSDGAFYVFKHARTENPDFIRGIRKEKGRVERLRKADLPHPEIVEAGEDYLLRDWVEGIRGDKWSQKWESAGAPKNAPELLNMREILKKAAAQGLYVGKLDPEDMIWDGKTWQIVDCGGIKDLSPKEALARYVEKMSLRWTSQRSTKKCMAKLLKK